jgi:hypothetical protein
VVIELFSVLPRHPGTTQGSKARAVALLEFQGEEVAIQGRRPQFLELVIRRDLYGGTEPAKLPSVLLVFLVVVATVRGSAGRVGCF